MLSYQKQCIFSLFNVFSLIESRGYFEDLVAAAVAPVARVIPAAWMVEVVVVLVVNGQLLVAQLGDLQPRMLLVVERGHIQSGTDSFGKNN